MTDFNTFWLDMDAEFHGISSKYGAGQSPTRKEAAEYLSQGMTAHDAAVALYRVRHPYREIA